MVNRGPILETLSQKLERHEKITLLNFFQGVPVKATATLQSLAPEKVTLVVEPPGSICLIWEKETWLVLEEAGLTARAGVESFDLLSGRLVLGGIEAAGPEFNRRLVVRVEPRAQIEVALESGRRRMIEYLADVSTGGIGVRIAALAPQQVFGEGEAVEIALRLPQGRTVVSGVIQNITRREDFYRLGVGFNQEQSANTLLNDYITQRQEAISEIIRIRYDSELKKLQDAARRPPAEAGIA